MLIINNLPALNKLLPVNYEKKYTKLNTKKLKT